MNLPGLKAVLSGLEVPLWWLAELPPSVVTLNSLLALPDGIQLVAQQPSTLHYEQQIGQGFLPTREGSWHDAFNAWIWSSWPHCKRALNRMQVEDVAQFGKQRSRRQMAITHLDESGLIVTGLCSAAVAAWDAHDWATFFPLLNDNPDAHARVFGHALLEHLKLEPRLLLTAKAILVAGCYPNLPALDAQLAPALGAALADPQNLRALPVSGIRHVWPDQDATFYRTAECFRPLRPGRAYPAASKLQESA